MSSKSKQIEIKSVLGKGSKPAEKNVTPPKKKSSFFDEEDAAPVSSPSQPEKPAPIAKETMKEPAPVVIPAPIPEAGALRSHSLTGEHTPFHKDPINTEPRVTEKDRHGLSYKELLSIQLEQLNSFQVSLKPSAFSELKAWALSENKQGHESCLHRVPRGFELCNQILEIGRKALR